MPKYRHELKYLLSMADYLTIRSRLSQVAQLDKNAGLNGKYRIRSLYFETPDDKALNDKLEGALVHEKYRIRFYNNDSSFIRLEKKVKINNATKKISCKISRDEVEKLIVGDCSWMQNSNRALIEELYVKMKTQQLRPKTIVDYDRECYIYDPGNVRVTLDSNISTGVSSIDLFNPNAPVVKAHGVTVILMEVKYDSYLPTIIHELVQLPNRRVTAFSKYAVARVFG